MVECGMKTKLNAMVVLALMAAPAAVYAQYANPAATPTTTASTRNLSLREVPQPVQNTINQLAAGRQIVKIDRNEWNGSPAYRVEFKEPGRNPDAYIAADGTLVRPEEKPPSAKTLFFGTTFKDTPAAVQQTLRRQVGDNEITKIDREGSGASRYYRVWVKDMKGATYQLQIAQDGTIQHDSRQDMNHMNR